MPTIKDLRTERGWTQQRLADEVGAHWNTVARWERGEVPPDRQSRKVIAMAFGLNVEEIDFEGPIAAAKSVA